jgi:hypothetical protein
LMHVTRQFSLPDCSLSLMVRASILPTPDMRNA